MPPRILIVEDDRATRLGLQELLRQAGYDVLAAAEFRDGRRALERDAPDLLIADLRLEGFNGLQLLHVNPRRIPAIIMTGYPDDVLRAEAQYLGAEFMLKPVVPTVLLATVERLLQAASGQERRRWPRGRPATDVPLEVDRVPARILDVSYGGVRVEIYRPGAQTLPRHVCLAFPVNDVSFEADLVWSQPDRAGRWLCGMTVAAAAAPTWQRLVDTIGLAS
jgi:CheY-like chemotaxis protein